MTTQQQQGSGAAGEDDGEYDAATWERRQQQAAAAAGPVKRPRRFEVTVGKPLGLYMTEGAGGPVVSRIVPGSNAEAAGLRVGDRIVAASAAVGSKLWTKATLAGVESAINSRFRFSDDITFCVERPLAPGAAADADSLWAREVEVFEVELERPVPLEFMQEDMEGGVFVRRVLPGAGGSEALSTIRPYDRVLAVSATLGDRMWRTRSLDGVLSAISTRIGPRVRLQLERSPEVARLVESYGERQQRRAQAGLLGDEEERLAEEGRSGGRSRSHSRARSGAEVGVGAGRVAGFELDAAGSKARTGAGAGAAVDESGLLLMGVQRGHQVLSQMSAALRERDPDRAISVYKLAVERGIAVDAHCCSSLIKAYGMRREAGKALEVVRMMPELGVLPDLVTYNALMDACEKGNKLEDARRIFREELRAEKGLAPDIFSYTVLINAVGKRGQLGEALALFEEAVARGLQPELAAYTAVVKAAVRKDDMGTALAMLKRMFDDGISPDTRLYNTLSAWWCLPGWFGGWLGSCSFVLFVCLFVCLFV
jgi:pentatricopeptide repeat protein